MGENNRHSGENRAKLKSKVAASIERINDLYSKITKEQGQILWDFEEIESFVARKQKKIASHKHNILEAQRESEEAKTQAIQQLTELLNN